MDHGNHSSGGWGWVIGVACLILLFWMLNQHSSSSSSGPAGSGEQTPSANSSDIAPSTDTQQPKIFAGYDCTGDCSGHEAGYQWAEEHDIDNEDDCDAAGESSNSPSFAEGCKAYVNGDSPDEEDDDDPDNQTDPDNDPQNSAVLSVTTESGPAPI